ncbi:hypothetical protein [Pseudonocardia humida]|uniref:Uncharacterized protein n=1 Tax=Pseudonocardia humida TaxID=2800819 RepID=A0ABT1AAS7_9PSEU|nr:hypothetical protein [Pseudonocardia humida]MCO1660152.1 hypothetical protein [Pseudonocardia humida]
MPLADVQPPGRGRDTRAGRQQPGRVGDDGIGRRPDGVESGEQRLHRQVAGIAVGEVGRLGGEAGTQLDQRDGAVGEPAQRLAQQRPRPAGP